VKQEDKRLRYDLGIDNKEGEERKVVIIGYFILFRQEYLGGQHRDWSVLESIKRHLGEHLV